MSRNMNCNGERLPLFFMANDAACSLKRRDNSAKSSSKLTLDELEQVLAQSAVEDEDVFGFVGQSEHRALAALNKRNADFWSCGGR
jgi:hypothetical protein